MVGFPFYNEIIDDDKVYVSEIMTSNGKYFVYGFILAIVTSPSICFADEVAINGNVNNVTAPAPSISPSSGNCPATTRNTAHGLIAAAGCTAAVKQCADVGREAAKAASNKLSTVSPPSALAVAGCLVLAGYCAGKLTTKGVDKLLGFN